MRGNCFKSLGAYLTLWGIGLFVCSSVGIAVVVSADLPTNYRLALLVGMLGTGIFAITANKRISLVIVWVLVHPLSIEKVFLLGQPIFPGFLPPTLVVSASDVVLFLLLATLIIEKAMAPSLAWGWPPLLTPLAFLAVWALICFMFQPYSLTSALTVLSGFKMLLYMFCLQASVRTREEFLAVLAAVLVAVGLQCLIVASSYFSARIFSFSSKLSAGLLGFTGADGQEYVRATGTLGHTNQQASFLTFYSAILIGLLAVPNKRWRGLTIIVLTGVALSLIYTFSRSAWAAAFLASLAILICFFRKGLLTPKRSMLLVPVAMVILLLGVAYGGRIADRLFYGDQGATASRGRAVSLAFDLAALAPLTGFGPGNFVAATLEQYPPSSYQNNWLKEREVAQFTRYDYGRLEVNQVALKDGRRFIIPLPVHNKFLLTLVELGAVGFGLFIWFQWRFLRCALACLKTTDMSLLWAGIGGVGTFWATQFYLNFDLFLDDKTMQVLLFVPALLIALQKIVETSQPADSAP